MPHMHSIPQENQEDKKSAPIFETLFERYEIVDPVMRERVRLGIGLGCVGLVIALNALLTFV